MTHVLVTARAETVERRAYNFLLFGQLFGSRHQEMEEAQGSILKIPLGFLQQSCLLESGDFSL